MATALMDDRTRGAEVIALLTEQCGLYAQLGQLSRGQRALITGESAEQLLAVLGERQRLIDRLEELGRRLRPFQRDWPAVRGAMSPSEGRRADELIARANGLLAGILQADAADAELLAARRGEAADGVTHVRSARKAGAAYAEGAASAGSRIDWTGA
ncbi:MAG: hypothetical protein AMXMBFR83_06140 [Phycisphaerae bacterium]